MKVSLKSLSKVVTIYSYLIIFLLGLTVFHAR